MEVRDGIWRHLTLIRLSSIHAHIFSISDNTKWSRVDFLCGYWFRWAVRIFVEKITKRKKQIRRELNLYPHYMSSIDRLDRMGAGRDTFPWIVVGKVDPLLPKCLWSFVHPLKPVRFRYNHTVLYETQAVRMKMRRKKSILSYLQGVS